MLALAAAALTPALCAPATGLTRGGEDRYALVLSVATNTVGRPGVPVRPGERLVRSYRLHNLAEYPLHGLRLVDPQAPGGAITCPHGDRLPGLVDETCTAVLKAGAAAGLRLVRVEASARAPGEYSDPITSAEAGYLGRASGLTLRREVGPDTALRSLPGPVRPELLRYRLAAPGSVSVQQLRLTDPLLAGGRLDCGGGSGLPDRLAAGATLDCTVVVPARPGVHLGTARALGAAEDGAVAEDGRPLPPVDLAAEATGGYTVAAPPPAAPAPPRHLHAPHPRPPRTRVPLLVPAAVPAAVPAPAHRATDRARSRGQGRDRRPRGRSALAAGHRRARRHRRLGGHHHAAGPAPGAVGSRRRRSRQASRPRRWH